MFCNKLILEKIYRNMKNKMTTLCYIEKDGKYLMLHRVSKKNDINKDKWIGVGGHFEEDESPEECLLREVREETGLRLTSWKFKGLITFCSEIYPTEYMCLFTADSFTGEIKECREGRLEWVEKDKIPALNLWDGDLLFLDLMQREVPFFSLKLCYDSENRLKSAALDGREMELFDLCDEKGRPTGHVMERSMVHRLGMLHRTVHIWVVQKNPDGSIEVLLQKRCESKDSYPGCYDISSAGHIHAGDDFESSAIRELEEELGIRANPHDLRFIGIHEGSIEAAFYGEDFKDHEISAVYLYEKPVDLEELTLQKSEVDSVMFMKYEQIHQGMKEKSLPSCIYPKELEMIQASMQNDFCPEEVWVKELLGKVDNEW